MVSGISLAGINENESEYNVLLVHSNSQDGSTSFFDNGKNQHEIMVHGEVQHAADQAKFGQSSIYFDGDGDYLSISDSADWDFGSEDFTTDFWVNFNNTATTQIIWEQGPAGADYIQVFFSSNNLYFYAQQSPAILAHYSTAWTPTPGVWYHIAVVRDGTRILIFIDGQSQSLTVNHAIGTSALPDVSEPLTIGARSIGGELGLDGYLDEFRISKGIARWTSNFRPPSYPYGLQPKYITASIDHSEIDEDLKDFPVLVHLSEESGLNGYDASGFFQELDQNQFSPNDSFEGINGDDPDPDRWVISKGEPELHNGRLHFDTSSGKEQVKSKYLLSGDFDIQVDWNIDNIVVQEWWISQLILYFPQNNNHWCYAGRGFSSVGSFFRGRYNNGGSNTTVQSSDAGDIKDYSLRLVRTGDLIFFYYKTTGDWISLGNQQMYATDCEVAVYLTNGDTNPSVSGFVDNFVVNHGEFVWPDEPPYRKKFAVYAADGRQCYTEIERWDAENKEAWVWVEIPEISSTEDTELKIYYDKDLPDKDIRFASEASDTFSIEDARPPAGEKWRILAGTPDILDGKLKLQANGSQETIASRWSISGDFDIQYDFDVFQPSSVSRWLLVLKAVTPGNKIIQVTREYQNGDLYRMYSFDSDWVAAGQAATDDNFGKIRLARVGNIFYGYYWDDSWVEIANTSMQGVQHTEDVQVQIFLRSLDDNPDVAAEVDNFLVSSAGAITGFAGTTGETPAQQVWDNNYVGVWHLSREPTGGSNSIADSSVYAHHGTPGGAMSAANLVDGINGKAIDFDGVDDFIDIGESTVFGANKGSISMWIKPEDHRHDMPFAFNRNSNEFDNRWYIYCRTDDASAGHITFYMQDNNLSASSGRIKSVYALDQWYHVSATWDMETKELKAYLNGQLVDTDTLAPNWDWRHTSQKLSIARRGDLDANYFDGAISNAQISKTNRSDAWIKASFLTLNDELIFYNLSTDNTPPAEIDSLDVSSGNDGSIILDWNGYDEADQGDISFYRIYVETSSFVDVSGLTPFATVNGGNFTYAIDNLGGNTTYYFAVVAVDHSGNALPTVSQSVTAVPKDRFYLKALIDHTKINEDLTDFPVLIHLSSASGQNGFDASDLFSEYMDFDPSDDFTSQDNNEINLNRWIVTGNASIKDNQLNLKADATTTTSRVESAYRLRGDFDIQMDFEVVSGPSVDRWDLGIEMRVDTHQYNLWRHYRNGYGNHAYQAWRYNGSSWTSGGSIPTTDLTGKLLVTRSNSTIKQYYWNGNSWVLITSWTNCPTSDVYFRLRAVVGVQKPSIEINIDNFKVNSGTIVWPNGHPHRKKMAIYDRNGQQCYTEIESWDSVNKKVWLWVRVPEVGAAQGTELKIYYGPEMADNDEYVGDPGEIPAQNVWDDNFRAVYHFGQASGSLVDSTSRQNHSSPVNLSSSERTKSSPIGNGYLFSGSEYINLPDNNDFKPDYITIEALARVNSGNPDWARIVDRYRHPSTGYALIIGNTGKFGFHPRLTGGIYSHAKSNTAVENDGKWHNVAGTYQAGKTRLFNDGVMHQEIGTADDVIAHQSTETPRIGVGVYDPYYFRGTISEIRISNIARSAAWLKATNYSNTDDLILYSISADLSAPGEVNSLVVQTQLDGTTAKLDWTGYDESQQGGIASYLIYAEATDISDTSSLSPVAVISGGNFTCTVENLDRNTNYHFAVVAMDYAGNADHTITTGAVSGTTVDEFPPEPVTNLRADKTDNSLTFTWDHSANTAGDLAGYSIYFDDDPTGIVLGGGQHSFVASDLDPATSYNFSVTSVDDDGNESEPASMSAVTLLDNPSDLSAVSRHGSIDLSWNEVSPQEYVDYYRIYVSETDFDSVEGMTPRLTTSSTSANINDLAIGVTYYFAVTTVDTSGGEQESVNSVAAIPLGEGVDGYTVLMIHSDNENGSVDFADNSRRRHSITANGDAHHEADQARFGQSSMYFDGSGDYLEISDDLDWDFGTGPFTMEAWIWLPPGESWMHNGIIGQNTNDNVLCNIIEIYSSPNGSVRWLIRTDGSGVVDIVSTAISTETWHHVAAVRDGDTFKLFIDGVLAGSETWSGSVDVPDAMRVGQRDYGTAYYFRGYIDEVRITKGLARWTENFSPPTSPYEEQVKHIIGAIDHAKIDETLTDFPVLIHLSGSSGVGHFDASNLFNELSSYKDRKKIAVRTADGKQCYTEIETWDAENKEAWLWVKVPEISATQDTLLNIYYNQSMPDQDSRPTSAANDTFDGFDGNLPDSSKWFVVSGSPVIFDNKLHLERDSERDFVESTFKISGDFDIQIDYDLESWPSESSWGLYFRVIIDDSNWLAASRLGSSTRQSYVQDSRINGVQPAVEYIDTEDTAGALKITRTGSTFQAYYSSDGINFTPLPNALTLGSSSDEVSIRLSASSWADNPYFAGNFDNFKINSADKITGFVGDTASTQAQNVWDKSFVGVWHMSQDPSLGSDSIKDSTYFKNHGTPYGNMSVGDLIDDIGGKALDFDGNDYIIVPYDNSLKSTDSMTVEGKVKIDNLNTNGTIISRNFGDGGTQYGFRIDSTGYLEGGITSNSYTSWINSVGTFSTRTWYSISVIQDAVAGNALRYLDGSEIFSSNITSGSFDTKTGNINIGRDNRAISYFNGIISEIRVSRIARSQAWLKATHYANYDNLIAYSSPQDITPPAEVDSLTVNPNGNGTTVTLGWSGYNEAAGDVAYYKIFVDTSTITDVSGLAEVAAISAGQSTYTVENLNPGTTYYFAVVAVDYSGNALDTVSAGVAASPVVAISSNTTINASNTSYDSLPITVDACTVTINGAHQFDSLSLINGAKITHSSNSTAQNNILDLTITNDLTIDETSLIDVNGRGYSSQQGPGKGADAYNSGGGAGHGGNGGKGYEGSGGGTHDSVANPSQIGSGGGRMTRHNRAGGNGGGGIQLSVGGVLTNNGTIRANGNNSSMYNGRSSGGGSGGFINLTAGEFTGGGTINANGGSAVSTTYTGGGGAGGRIAIYYNTNDYKGSVSAFGGSGKQAGAAGSIYFKSNTSAEGRVIYDNNGNSGASTYMSGILPDLVIRQKAVVVASNEVTAEDCTIDNAYFYANKKGALANLVIKRDGYLRHSSNSSSQNYIIDMDVSGSQRWSPAAISMSTAAVIPVSRVRPKAPMLTAVAAVPDMAATVARATRATAAVPTIQLPILPKSAAAVVV